MSGICSDPDIQEGAECLLGARIITRLLEQAGDLIYVYGRLREDFQGVCSDELDDIFILLVCFGFGISPVIHARLEYLF